MRSCSRQRVCFTAAIFSLLTIHCRSSVEPGRKLGSDPIHLTDTLDSGILAEADDIRVVPVDSQGSGDKRAIQKHEEIGKTSKEGPNPGELRITENMEEIQMQHDESGVDHDLTDTSQGNDQSSSDANVIKKEDLEEP
ncbi:MAG: hypothetical protein OEQ53_11840, partial [Saprospiraceae bacterium]|nr:hypothetical protein [Saprospiraceae bacterium]